VETQAAVWLRSVTCRLLCTSKNVSSFAIKQTQTLFAKQWGGGPLRFTGLWVPGLRPAAPSSYVASPRIRLASPAFLDLTLKAFVPYGTAA
jgi:hypothetical protein